MFSELKHYLCDKDAIIKHTIIGHLEMLAQKFEDHYGKVLTPSHKDDWILDPFADTDLPHLPLHVAEEFMNMTTKVTNRISFASLKEQYPNDSANIHFWASMNLSVSNSYEICDKKIDSVCDNLALRNCI